MGANFNPQAAVAGAVGASDYIKEEEDREIKQAQNQFNNYLKMQDYAVKINDLNLKLADQQAKTAYMGGDPGQVTAISDLFGAAVLKPETLKKLGFEDFNMPQPDFASWAEKPGFMTKGQIARASGYGRTGAGLDEKNRSFLAKQMEAKYRESDQEILNDIATGYRKNKNMPALAQFEKLSDEEKRALVMRQKAHYAKQYTLIKGDDKLEREYVQTYGGNTNGMQNKTPQTETEEIGDKNKENKFNSKQIETIEGFKRYIGGQPYANMSNDLNSPRERYENAVKNLNKHATGLTKEQKIAAGKELFQAYKQALEQEQSQRAEATGRMLSPAYSDKSFSGKM